MRYLSRLIAGTLTIIGITFSGCTRGKEATPSTKVPCPAQAKAFVPPTAEEAYRLQDDCTHRGEKILRENAIGIALAHEQVSRYNPTTNRCYVRLEVHAGDPTEFQKYDFSTYLFDGQTGEMLASFTVKAGGARWYQGFGCDLGAGQNSPCVEERVADCMSGKECEP
jgi:hypothetical protein